MVHDIALNKLKRIKTVFFSPDFSSKNDGNLRSQFKLFTDICQIEIKTSLEIFVTKSENQLSKIKTLPPTDSLR